MSTSTERSDARRASILEAARRLLIRRGYQDFVMDDLAREAGVAKGTLFLHFKTKDDLLFATFGELVDQLGTELETLAKSEPRGEALLEKAIATILGHFDRNMDFLSQFGAGRFPGCGDKNCDKLMAKFGRNLKSMAVLLRLAQGSMKVRFKDADASAAVVFGLCRSALLYRKITGGKGPLADRSGWVLEQFLYGSAGRRP